MPHAAQLSSAPAIQGLVPPVEPPTRQGLEQAFSQFSQMSSQLTDSYSLLEARVSELKGELAVVSAQRMEELAEKERLANRLQNLLSLLPGGVIVIDEEGRVREANPAACDMLGLPLEGDFRLRQGGFAAGEVGQLHGDVELHQLGALGDVLAALEKDFRDDAGNLARHVHPL